MEFQGKFYRVPESIIGPKPVQKPHPPIYLASFAPPALKRIAKLVDGSNPVVLPPDVMAQMFSSIQEMAKAEGRDPASLQLVVRANLDVTEKPLGKDRWLSSGTVEQIKEEAGLSFRSERALRGGDCLHGNTFGVNWGPGRFL